VRFRRMPTHRLVAALLLLGSVVGTASAASNSSWRGCGVVHQATANGYAFSNRVEARDRYSCSEARHIGERFASSGYTYRGLTCFYARWEAGRSTGTGHVVRVVRAIGTAHATKSVATPSSSASGSSQQPPPPSSDVRRPPEGSPSIWRRLCAATGDRQYPRGDATARPPRAV
jgi:hypothetical protein